MPRPLLNLATALSLLLLIATITCWLTGLARPRHATVFPVRPRPEQTFFLRIDRQHLVLCDQQMAASNMPPGYALDSTRFRQFKVNGPQFPTGATVELAPDSPMLNPTDFGFHKTHVQPAGMKMLDPTGTRAWQAVGFYNAIEIPWWSLVLLFSLLPATRLITHHRRRAKTKRGLCPTCGYDLRATPNRCPECGAAATGSTP